MAYHDRYCMSSESGDVAMSGSAAPTAITPVRMRQNRSHFRWTSAPMPAASGKSFTNAPMATATAAGTWRPPSYATQARIMRPATNALLCARCTSPTTEIQAMPRASAAARAGSSRTQPQ